jgi:hypothetical protein
MDNSFELPLNYKGKELVFEGQLHQYGYTHKIEININGVSVMYERDDERNWRAIVEPGEIERNKFINTELLQAIANAIEEVLQ